MALSRTTAGTAMGITTALAWGGMFAVAKSALAHVDAFHLTLVRYGAASLVFVALLAWREGRSALSTSGRGLELFLLGALGFAGFNLPAYVALDSMPAQSASLLVATMPLLGALVAWAQTRVRPPRAIVVGGLVALVGVALVLSGGDLSTLVHGTAGRGSLLVLSGVLAFVVYTRGAARFPEMSALRYTSLTAVGGTIAILAATLVAEDVGYVGHPALADYGAVIPQIAYVVLVAAVLAVLTWNGAVRALGPLNASLFVNGVTLTAFAIEVVRGYRPGSVEIAGATLTVAALVGTNLAQRRHPAAAPAATSTPAPSQVTASDRVEAVPAA